MSQGNSGKSPSGRDRSASGEPKKPTYEKFFWWSKEPGARAKALEEFKALPDEAQGRLLSAIGRYKRGESRSQDVEKIGGEIWELRVRAGGNNQFRVLFFHWGSYLVGLTCFYKNQRKLSPQEIARAKTRMSEWKTTRGDL